MEAERMLCPVRQLKLYIWDSERIWGGGGGGGGCQRMFIHWNHNIRDIMRSHISRWIVETVKEAYTQANWEFDRVMAQWGQSPFGIMAVQLSGCPSWHPVSGILEVTWGLPEFVSMRHGLYRWWHVDTGSSGGRTTSSGSRTSSPSSITYAICMQPLLWHS